MVNILQFTGVDGQPVLVNQQELRTAAGIEWLREELGQRERNAALPDEHEEQGE